MVFGSGEKPGYAVGMRKDVVDADFEVISGPSPVRWSAPLRRREPWFKLAYAALIGGLALFVLALGLSGVDLDTRDAVKASQASQPVAAAIVSPE